MGSSRVEEPCSSGLCKVFFPTGRFVRGMLEAAPCCFSVLREGGPALCLQPAVHRTALRHDVTSPSDHYLLWVPSVFTSSFSLLASPVPVLCFLCWIFRV